jgi:hypothetical protein
MKVCDHKGPPKLMGITKDKKLVMVCSFCGEILRSWPKDDLFAYKYAYENRMINKIPRPK